MTAAEFEQASRLAEELPLPVEPVRRRRHEAAARGRLDLRATMLRMARQPETLAPAYTRERMEPPPLVVLLDISGSMDRYARLLLHYIHGLTRRQLRVHTLTFGTRLTDITRCLRHHDPDIALRRADEAVQDWKGGTRIASCLDDFNRHWARRLLGSNAAVLLATDGLDRDEHGDLGAAAARLRRHAHRVVWLNPLLRFDGFEPRAAGIRALLPHVDRFLPMHNLASLDDLGRALRTATERPAALLCRRCRRRRLIRINAPRNLPCSCKAKESFPASIDTTWAALNDPEVLKACIAGCESLERTGDDAYAAVVAVKVGPVGARFKGNLKLTDVQAPNSYTIHFDGQGGVAGFGKGSADVALTAETPTETKLVYDAKAQIGGKLAQVGSQADQCRRRQDRGRLLQGLRGPSAGRPRCRGERCSGRGRRQGR